MTDDTPDFYLYHTLGCHLCEEAEVLVAPAAAELNLSWKKFDIVDDDALVDAYGIRIPVLQALSTKVELGWPFTAAEVYAFMEAQCQS